MYYFFFSTSSLRLDLSDFLELPVDLSDFLEPYEDMPMEISDIVESFSNSKSCRLCLLNSMFKSLCGIRLSRSPSGISSSTNSVVEVARW